MRSATAALLFAALLACVVLEPPAPASVRVDVVRTALPVLDWNPSQPPPVHLLLDVTPSMREASTEGVTHLQTARRAAGKLLYSLPPDADIRLHALGTAGGAACTAAVPIEVAPGSSPREGLAEIAQTLPSRSEGSLVGALEAIARRIRAEEQGQVGVRLVAISDLDDSCGEGDLCDTAAVLSSAGASLDLVVVGDAPIPACLGQVGGDGEPPLFAAAPAGPIRATFRLIGGERGNEVLLPEVGTVGGTAVEVAPGRIRVAVDLDPPVEVGPVDLAPNASLRIRILELPADESQRWQVFVDGMNPRAVEGSVP